jgi:hypothetical protein
MKTLVAVFSMFIFSIFADYSSTNFEKNQECTHCQYIKKYESKSVISPDQPNPYLQDSDSNLVIYPILENADLPGDRWIRDIKFIYKDKHYCSDLTKVTFVTKDKSFSVVSLQRMSCKIMSIVRLDDSQVQILKKNPVSTIIIENLVTDNIYNYTMNDSLYFVKVFKLDDSKPVSNPVKVFTPKKSGFVK